MGFRLQDLPIDRLGRLQATGVMVLDGNRHRFGNRCHDVDYDAVAVAAQRPRLARVRR
jgi:hypothetical protein